MSKKRLTLYNSIRYAIVLLCIAFIVYQLLKVDNWSEVLEQLSANSAGNIWFGVVALLLLPLNILLESLRWQKATEKFVDMPLKRAIRSVFWGYTGAFITPNSLGELPTRAMLLPEGSRTKAVSMGFFVSLLQTILIVACGLVATLFWQHSQTLNVRLTVVIASVVIVLGSLIVLKINSLGKLFGTFGQGFFQKISEALNSAGRRQTIMLALLSLLKYAVYSTQFYLVLRWSGVEIPVAEAFVVMPIFYLLLTIMPLVNIFEFAVRSSVGILVFSAYAESSLQIIVASTIFWLMNFCLPTLIGLFLGGVKKT